MHSHVLFVAQDATADALPCRRLRQLGFQVHPTFPAEALARARDPLPDLIVWAAPEAAPKDGFRDFRLDPVTWNVPIVQLADEEAPIGDLFVEPEVRLVRPSEAAFAEAVVGALAARDQRLREGVWTEVRLRLPSDLDQLERLCLLMTDWFALCGLKTHQGRQANQAVRELAANAIEWGHRYERSRLVEVCSWLEEDRVCVLVRDSGPGFDPRNLPHAARPGDSLSHLDVRAAYQIREGGFGILMASGLVDHLCYNDKGNEGLVVKFLPRSPRAARGDRTGPLSPGLAS